MWTEGKKVEKRVERIIKEGKGATGLEEAS